MLRIATATKAANLFGAGKDGFKDGDAVSGVVATDLEAKFFNHIQEAVVRTIEAAGLVLSGTDYDQFNAALNLIFAKLLSPTFTGTPAGPTAALGTNTTQLATTAFALAEITNQFNKSGQHSLASAGYQKFPGGLIFQWGTASVNSAGTTVTFPVAFPTACRNVMATNRHQGAFDLWAVDSFTAANFIGWANNASVTNGYYLAIGD